MTANSFGERFRITSFGESHGPALGVVIEGCPAGLEVDEALLKNALERRRPGSSAVVSGRAEDDHPEILSGVFDGKTLGTPIAVIVRNHDARSQDYKNLAPRPGHADDVWVKKFGWSDPRGGGRSSGRETLSRVIGGAFAQMLVRKLSPQSQVLSFAQKIGPYSLSASDVERAQSQLSTKDIDAFVGRFPSRDQSQNVEKLLLDAKAQGKSYGGLATVVVRQPPPFLGQPVFLKLKAQMAQAFMSLGATAGFEIGEGFAVIGEEGSAFHNQGEGPYGGIRGGISTGQDIIARVAFKPTSSVLDVAKKGRHDPCIVPRALPVLEAMLWIILADQLMYSRSDRV